MSMTSTGGAGFNSGSSYGAVIGNKSVMRTIENEPSGNLIGAGIGGGPIRPPLYVPSKREGGRTSIMS